MGDLQSVDNIKDKDVFIDVNGAQYKLKFTLNSMAAIEEHYDSVEKAFDDMEKGKFRAIRCVLYAGLIDSYPEATLINVGNLFTIKELIAVSTKLAAAAENSMPNQPEEEKQSIPNE